MDIGDAPFSRRTFGTTGDGRAVDEVLLVTRELAMSVISWGAAIRDLRPRSGPMAGQPLVLGLDTLADYEAHSPHFGAVAGRCANRIAGGRFTLDGRTVELTRNTADGNHLHGGAHGFGMRPWRIARADARSVTLALSSPDGDEGYPGAVEARVTYRLDGAKVVTEIDATCDAPTLVNLAQHSYFNLDGGGDIHGHRLMIAADRMTPTDRALIPTGEIRAVDGTAFDFRNPRPVRAPGAAPVVYDLNYCLAAAPRGAPAHAATLEGPGHGLRLDLWTTEPGLQLYDGGTIACAVAGLDGRAYGPHSGLCLEPQRWPDAANHPGFAGAVLRPGATYRQVTEFRFSW